MRRIEEQNPDLEFDWPRIMKGQGSPATEPRPPATNGDVRRPSPHETRRVATPLPLAQPFAEAPLVEATAPEEETASPEATSRESAPRDEDAVVAERRDEPLDVVSADVVIPAHDKLGVDGVQRLRHRYAEIIMRIGERVADPVRRDELKATAERLNPDAWLTQDEVAVALEQYEAVLASVREVVGRRRRRRRRGSRGADAKPAQLNGQPESAGDDTERAAEPGDLEPEDAGGDEL